MEDFNMNMDNMRKRWKPKKPKVGKGMKRAAAVILVLAVAGVFATDCTYQIQEQEQAVLTTFGVPKAVT